MESLISKAFLLSGRDFRVSNCVTVHHPTVPEILDINGGILCEEIYWLYVSTIMSDPYDYMVMLDDIGIDYEKSNAFEVFAHRWTNAQAEYVKNKATYDQKGASPLTIYDEAMSFFFGAGRSFRLVKYKGQMFIVDDNDGHWALDKDGFCAAMEFIVKINCIDGEEHIKPATPAHKRILIDDKRMEEKKRARKQIKKREKIDRIGDALATVFSCGAGAITPDNYHKVHIHQLLSSALSIQKQMVVQSKFNGIYCGMLKSDKISDDELRWV